MLAALGDWVPLGLPELPHSIFSLSPLAEAPRAQHHPHPRLDAPTWGRIWPSLCPGTLLLQTDCAGKGFPCS